MKKVLFLLIMACTFCACNLYKKYERPSDVQIPGNENKTAADGLTVDTIHWRDFFKDDKLQSLIEQGLNNNADLQSAQLQIEEADASLHASKLYILPTLSFSPNGTLSSYDNSSVSKTYELPIQASWQIDLFGSKLNNKRSVKEALDQKLYYKQAVQSQLIADIATYYYQLSMLDEELVVLDSTAQNWAENVKATKALMQSGTYTQASVAQAEADYLNVCASMEDVKQEIEQTENSLCALVGCNRRHIERNPFSQAQTPDYLLSGVSVHQLANRPDVKRAESVLASSFYLTNEARASLYPSLTLSGSFGWTNSAGNIINNPGAWLWSAAASLTQPLFQQGKLKAQLKIAKAQQEESKIAFKQKILDAGKEVNNALSKAQYGKKKEIIYEKQVASLDTAVRATKLLMKYGNTSYLEVLTAQQSLLNAQLSVLTNKANVIYTFITLYQSLGGGAQ